MSREQEANGSGAGRTIIEEVRQIVAAVEEFTGLPSRWNGGLLILADASGEARAAEMLTPLPYFAKKEWSCGITILESVLQDDQRWRTLLHEALHSVSVGLTEPRYHQYAPWEEGIVESLQRYYRPFLLENLGIDVLESQFALRETTWRYNSAIAALTRIGAERPEVPLRDFLELLLRTSLPDRPAVAFEWGRETADFGRFKRVFAAASGILR